MWAWGWALRSEEGGIGVDSWRDWRGRNGGGVLEGLWLGQGVRGGLGEL